MIPIRRTPVIRHLIFSMACLVCSYTLGNCTSIQIRNVNSKFVTMESNSLPQMTDSYVDGSPGISMLLFAEVFLTKLSSRGYPSWTARILLGCLKITNFHSFNWCICCASNRMEVHFECLCISKSVDLLLICGQILIACHLP